MAKISTARSDKVKVDQKDLFISYTASDQNWAVWIAEEVERVGYSTVIQAWDFQVGQNFIHNMHLAIINARATAVIMSKSYFKSQFATDEWTAALAKRVLIPIRIEKMTPPGLFAPISYIDLAGLAQDAASAVLLKGVRSAFAGLDKRRTKPVSAGGSPGTVGASAVVSEYPGSLPLVWNVPRRRNRQFAGREDALHRLEATLGIGKLSVVAITGLDGTGKTELAAEYAYRHRSQYDTVWWVRAEGADTLIEDYCSLGRTRRLKIDPKQARAKTAGKVRDWLERNTRWLVIFDDAEMEGVEPYLPSIGDGAVIITTRQPTWGKLASVLALDVWSRRESEAFLLQATAETDVAGASRVAEALGDLPIALDQAAAYVIGSGTTLHAYGELLDKGYSKQLREEPRSFGRTVAVTWELSLQRIQEASPGAACLLSILAFLAPDSIPISLFRDGARYLPEPLADAADSPVAFDGLVATLREYSLIQRRGELLSVHRLVQATSRDRLDVAARTGLCQAILKLINSELPRFAHGAFDATAVAIHDLLSAHALAAVDHAQSQHVTSPVMGRILNEVGFYRQVRGDYEGAKLLFDQALEADTRQFGSINPMIAVRLSNTGLALLEAGDVTSAMGAFRQALSIEEQLLGPDHPNVATRLNNLGSALNETGDYVTAVDVLKRACTIDKMHFGVEHPLFGRDLGNLGISLLGMGQTTNARFALERAIQIIVSAMGPDSPEAARYMISLGVLLEESGNVVKAREKFQQAAAMFEKSLGSEHPDLAVALDHVGRASMKLGDRFAAKEAFARAVKIGKKAWRPDHFLVAQYFNNLGNVLQDEGDLSGAKSAMEEAVRIARKVLPDDHPERAVQVFNLGTVLERTGDLRGARNALNEAVEAFMHSLGPGDPRTQLAQQRLAGLGQQLTTQKQDTPG